MVIAAYLIVALVVSVSWFSTRDDTSKNNKLAILATVGDREITVEEFSRLLLRRGGGLVGGFSNIEYKNKLLDDIIAHEVQVQYAMDAGYADQQDVRRTFERIMVRKMREMELDKQLDAIVIDHAQVQQLYQSRIADFTQEEMVRVAVIHLSLPRGASAQRRSDINQQAAEILTLATSLPANTRGFGYLAAHHSEHQASRYRGGDTGWYARGEAGKLQQPSVIDAIQTLKQAGALSGVIEAKDGLYLLKLMAVRLAKVTPLSTVRLQLENTLLTEKRATAELAWIESVKRKLSAKIEVNETLLELVSPPVGTPTQKPITTPANLPNG